MIDYSLSNLFPLLPLGSFSYKESQDHSQWVDEQLGFRCHEIELQIQSQNSASFSQNWSHLDVQAFQTPYVELRALLDLIKPKAQQKIMDLGCAYGRLGLVIGAHYPDVFFQGFELEEKRVAEALRIYQAQGLSENINVAQKNLQDSSFELPFADVYFIFDYGTEAAVKSTLQQIQNLARNQKVRVVARGRLVRFLIHQLHPWLCQVQEPVHTAHFSIYSS